MTIPEKVIKKVKVGDIDIYPNYITIFGAIQNQQLYLQMTKELGYLGLPLCYEEAGKIYCIAEVEGIEAAKTNGLTEIEVEVRDIPEKDRLKYLSLTILYKMKEYKAISIFIEILEVHFKTPDGISWCLTLPKDRKARLAFVTGLSESTIQRYLTVGAKYRHLLDDLQNGNLNWRELIDHINRLENPSRYANEYDRIEKEREVEEARKKVANATNAAKAAQKLAADLAEKERLEAEAAAEPSSLTKLRNASSAPMVYADKTATKVLDSKDTGSNQNNQNENSKDEQSKDEKSAKPWLFSANIIMESGLEIATSSTDLCLNGEEIKVLVDNQVSGSTYSSTFSLESRPEIKISFTIENYEELEDIVTV